MYRRSFTLRCYVPADFVEEIHCQRYMILRFSRSWTLRRHQDDEALAVGGEIEVSTDADIRKLLFGPHPRLVRHKRLSLHCVIRYHDPLVVGAVEQLMSISRPDRYRPAGVGN